MSSELMALATQPNIALTAVDLGRNIARAYHVDRSVDLFEWHMVCWSWGRIGHRRPPKIRAFQSEAEAIGFVRQLLARRAGAPARIGVTYKPVGDDKHFISDTMRPARGLSSVSASGFLGP